MAKDVFWFKHDSNAARDIKLMHIKHIHDFWGIGLYWCVVEVLREQPKYKFSCSESGLGLLCTLVMCNDINRFTTWYNDCVRIGLFCVENVEFFSASLCERMSDWETKKTNGGAGGRPKKTETITESKAKRNRNNNRNRTIREEKRRREKNIFIPPSALQVVEYFNLNGYSSDAGERAFKYYDEANWKDSRGKQVLNWKQKMQANWFKPENKAEGRKVAAH